MQLLFLSNFSFWLFCGGRYCFFVYFGPKSLMADLFLVFIWMRFFFLRFPYALHCVPIVSFYLLTRRWYSKRLNSFACLIWSSLVAHHSRHNQCTTMHNKMVNWLLTYYEESMKLVEKKNMFRKVKKKKYERKKNIMYARL